MEKKQVKEILRKHRLWLIRGETKGERASFSREDLMGIDLSKANLTAVGFAETDLSYANLDGADMREAYLRHANLRGASLWNANLEGADINDANFSGAFGLLSPARWIEKNFRTDKDGVIVYKSIHNTIYRPPARWIIAPGKYIHEVVNPCPTSTCACGINFGTKKWCLENFPTADLWKCRIHWLDLASVVVPYNTDGKARCGKLQLIKKIKRGKS